MKTSAPASADALLSEAFLAEAAELARHGDFEPAETLVRRHIQARGASVPALDLLARICAQQGELIEAASCWRRALELDPTHEASQAGIDRIRRAMKGRVRTRAPWLTLLGMGLVAWIVFTLRDLQRTARAENELLRREVIASLAEDRASLRSENTASTGTVVAALREQAAAIAKSARELDARIDAVQEQQKTALAGLAQTIAAEGSKSAGIEASLKANEQARAASERATAEHAAALEKQLSEIFTVLKAPNPAQKEIAALQTQLKALADELKAISAAQEKLAARLPQPAPAAEKPSEVPPVSDKSTE